MSFVLHYRLFKGMIAAAEQRNGSDAADEAARDLIDAVIAAAVHRFGVDKTALILETALSSAAATGDDL